MWRASRRKPDVDTAPSWDAVHVGLTPRRSPRTSILAEVGADGAVEGRFGAVQVGDRFVVALAQHDEIALRFDKAQERDLAGAVGGLGLLDVGLGGLQHGVLVELDGL